MKLLLFFILGMIFGSVCTVFLLAMLSVIREEDDNEDT